MVVYIDNTDIDRWWAPGQDGNRWNRCEREKEGSVVGNGFEVQGHRLLCCHDRDLSTKSLAAP